MSPADQVCEVIREALATTEFRDLCLRIAMAKFGADLAEVVDESAKDTVVEGNGMAANLTPLGLAWHFRSMTGRRPNSQESEDAVVNHMQGLIGSGIPAKRILDVMKLRGMNLEPIWDFVKRVKAAVPVKTGPTPAERAAETARRIQMAEGS